MSSPATSSTSGTARRSPSAYGRYGPDQSLQETILVDDVMVVLEGRVSVTSRAGTVIASPGEIIHMPKGEAVTIRSHAEGAITAYVTYPHWQEASP